MTKTTTNLLLMLFTILGGTFAYITFCSECGASTKEIPVKEEMVAPAPAIPEATSYPLAFSDGDYAYSANDNYNFNVSSSSIMIPLSQKVMDGISSLKTFLSANANKVINLTGYYKSDETNDSAFPNLGLARANAVKNHFTENGIPSSQINVMGELMDEMVPKDNMYLGPVAYGLGDQAENAEDELNALYEKITADPLILYFNSGKAAINLSAEQRQKVADISKYLDKVEGATIKVVGHTDNTGRRATNIKLGQGRADFAKAYLVKNGIPEAKTITASEGPDSPIASNTTEEGRSKNRRTVVKLNK